MGYDVNVAADLERLRAPDSYEQELIVAAEVRAYFQVAYKVSFSARLAHPKFQVLTTNPNSLEGNRQCATNHR